MNKSFYVLGCTIQIECHQFFHGIPQVCAVAKNHGMRARYKSTGARIPRGYQTVAQMFYSGAL